MGFLMRHRFLRWLVSHGSNPNAIWLAACFHTPARRSGSSDRVPGRRRMAEVIHAQEGVRSVQRGCGVRVAAVRIHGSDEPVCRHRGAGFDRPEGHGDKVWRRLCGGIWNLDSVKHLGLLRLASASSRPSL